MKKFKWNKTQIKALKAAILHWVRMLTNKRRWVGDDYEEPNADCCACCKRWNKATSSVTCARCPICIYTSRKWCYRTPYIAAGQAFDSYGHKSRKFKAAAQKEIDFLNKVLKAGE